MLQEQSERPDLLVGQGTLPRGHARPANAMLYFPIGEAFGIVLYAIRRQLRRSWVEAFRNRRGGRVAVRRTVAERAVPPIQVYAGYQIVVRQRDGIGTLRRIAVESRIKRRSRRPRFQPPGTGIGVGRNEPHAQSDVTA